MSKCCVHYNDVFMIDETKDLTKTPLESCEGPLSSCGATAKDRMKNRSAPCWGDLQMKS
jgi:hypothetical protein